MFAEYIKKRITPAPATFPFVVMDLDELKFVHDSQKEFFTYMNKTSSIVTFEALEVSLASFQNQEISESALLPFNLPFYKDIARKYDFCNPATWEDSKRHLDLSMNSFFSS